MKNCKTGILGLGSIGRRHLGNIRRLGCEEIIAFEPDDARAESVRTEFGIATTSRLDSFWNSGINVALITSPTAFHREQAAEALRHDMDVFIEKPLAHSETGLAEVVSLSQGSGRITMVGCNLQFHPLVIEVNRLLRSGRLGQVFSFRAEFGFHLPDWHPWEDYRNGYSARKALGGGIILDAIHELNLVRHLFGDVAEISCFHTNTGALQADVEDCAAMMLRMHDRVIGEVHLDYLQRQYSRSLKIVGEHGNAIADFKTGSLHFFSKDETEQLYSIASDWDSNSMYVDEMKHFLASVSSRTSTACPVAAGAEDLRIALAAYRSQELGRVVRIDEVTFDS